jgi:alpha-tubulin suppressor-like RCC1 family protein
VQVTGTWLEVAAGQYHTCAIATGGALWCWGENYNLQCGQATGNTYTTPVQVGSATSWAHVYSNNYAGTTCAQDTTGQLWCWGYDMWGELGDGGSQTPSEVPHAITSATDWSGISIGGLEGCGLRAGVVWCWGMNPASGAVELPRAVTAAGFVEVAVATGTVCALDASGQRWCWGYDGAGILGDGKAWTSSFVPVAIP